MGQVPQQYTIIGAGRVARHMCQYFNLLGIAYQQWSRQSPIFELEQYVQHSQRVLILISDSAIEKFILEHPCLANKTLIHFSGSLQTKYAYACHPLMTFTESLYDLARYQQIPFILERGGPIFNDLLPELNNPHYFIDAEKKALYHALCVVSGNFSTLLWQRCFNLFEQQLDMPAAILQPYLQQITENLMTQPHRALTGPLARGDLVTMQKNLNALQATELQDLYRSFIKSFSPQHKQELDNEYS